MTSLVPNMFEKTCRTCLSTSGEMVPIFSSDIYVKQLPKKLMAFTKVEILDNDDLPKIICKKCIFMADSFYCFKEQCESADIELKLLIQKSLNRDNSPLNIEKELDSDSRSKKNSLAPVRILKKATLDVENFANEAKNVVKQCLETEDNYFVEYISEEIKIEVENALKRRREAEKRISIEKVSEKIKNLSGIEVVPISNDVNSIICNAKSSKMKEKEEIVVFPIEVPKKRCKIIETIVIDDPLPLNKRLKLPPETTVSKISTEDLKKTRDSIVYGKYKKLNFSTIRKVVKIDDEELCIESKEENIQKSDEENPQIRYDTNVVVAAGNDNDKRNTQFEYPEIEIDKKVSETNPEKQVPVVIKDQFQGNSKDGDENLRTKLVLFKDALPADKKNLINPNEKNKQQLVIASQEPKEIGRCRMASNSRNHGMIKKSAVDGIISKIQDENFDGEDISILENTNDTTNIFDDHQTDESVEVFIENGASIARDTRVIAESSNIEEEKAINKNLKLSKSLSCLNEVTPLALLRVNSSGEENSTINIKIYKRTDSERIEGTTNDDTSVDDETPAFSSHQSPRNSSLKLYQCTICSINFASMPSVLKHNIKVHMVDKSPFFCLICGKNFQDKSSLCEHVEEHNGSKPYQCNFCPKAFTLQRNLKRHINHHINYKLFECRICMKKFNEKSSLKSHMQLHTADSPFACKSCNVSFNNKTNWRRHIITVHEKVNVVVCKFCNKELPDKKSLRVHTRVHTGEKPYQCPHCDKKFTQQCNLNTHIHCHLNDRPFACPHCEKKFNQRGTRDDHILTHTGEKPYKCTECEASFTVASALKRHMWIHTNKDRPYNCDKCKLKFVGLYDLRKHLKIRHGEIVKPENPRVERVQLMDHKNKETEGLDNLCEIAIEFNETEKTDAIQSSKVIESGKSEITAKENSSLSCNVNKIEDVQMEEMNEKFSVTKNENSNI